MSNVQDEQQTASYVAGAHLPPAIASELPRAFVDQFQADPAFVGVTATLPRTRTALAAGEPAQMFVERHPGDLVICRMRYRLKSGDAWSKIVDCDTAELYRPEQEFPFLPLEFCDYYRWLDGIQLVDRDSEPRSGWADLPYAVAQRWELADLAKQHGESAYAVAEACYAALASKRLSVWVKTLSGGLVFANEHGSSRVLYHVNMGDQDGTCHPVREGFLDDYVSYVLSNGTSAGFSMRSWLSPTPVSLRS